MTQAELIDLEERVGKNMTGPDDVEKLLAYTESLSDKLSTCWLVLDQIARGHMDGRTGMAIAAAKVLREQECPGWKTREPSEK